MKERNLTKSALARRLGVSPTAVHNWLLNDRVNRIVPSVATLDKIAAYFQVDPAEWRRLAGRPLDGLPLKGAGDRGIRVSRPDLSASEALDTIIGQLEGLIVGLRALKGHLGS